METVAQLVERALQLPEPPGSWWHRAGVSPRAERWLEVISSVVLAVLAVAWIWTIVQARALTTAESGGEATTPTTRSVAAALTNPDAPSTAYLTSAALEALVPLRGASGKVRIVMRTPGDSAGALPHGAEVVYGTDSAAPRPSAVGQVALRVANALRPVTDLSVVTLTPLSERKGGRIGLYYIGSWPTEHGARGPAKAPPAKYAPPRGLIEVTPETQDTRLSEHLRIRDFLTHDQQNVWPKYVVVQPSILDKDELVLADLESHGIAAKGFHVMSGFRSPQYNAGGGDKTGRANLSRHMYGDANDIWIDNDGDGQMDDLNHDGRIDIRDAQVVCSAVERVEQAHPELVGGCGIYPGNGAHGPFTHIDARGYRARWTGGSNGG
ncbi:protein of unknown function DUF882 [Gemmatirosa kalamazoonensis]|uniref:Peptidase M15A n=1 Tax=Gemmatirosa kalamazoonensis TaxID=861299 RepID=W0RJ91_9BACT|nr:DUF882 domain-containing protein [Gemmatirosa kalamazoonensis]AHG90395.1 protein of unknown function DUF882 [Gemmatirosa kalamazoonensis]